MDLHVRGMPAPPLHRLPRQKISKALATRAAGPTAPPSTAAPHPPAPDTDASHEHLLVLLSKIDPLPQLQTIPWIPTGLGRRYAAVRLQALDRAMQAAKANTAAPHPSLDSAGRLATSNKKKGWAASGTKIRNLEQLLHGAIEDQEKQTQQKRGSEGPGATDTEDENDRLLRAAKAADRGQSRTAARLFRGPKLLPPTEAAAEAVERRYRTSDAAQQRTDAAFESLPQSPKSYVRQQHIPTHMRDAIRTSASKTEWRAKQVHFSSRVVATWPVGAHTRGTIVGRQESQGDRRRQGEEARQGRLPLRIVTSSTLRAHISKVRKVAGSYQFGMYREGGAPEIAWNINAKMAAEPTKVFNACDTTNLFGAARRGDAVEGARRWWCWEGSSPTCGQ